jgi:hypothetical protein
MTENLPARQQDSWRTAKVDLTKPIADLDQAIRVSDVLARSELVPKALYGKPASVLHVIVTGQSLGLHWIESVRVIYSPGPGQIGMRGQFLLSRLRQAGHRYSFSEGDGYCTFKLTRGDTKEEFESTFTIEDAIQGGLATRNEDGQIIALSRDGKKLPWMSWTRRMLRWRSVSDGVSIGAPEVSLGFEVEGAEAPAGPEPDVVLRPAEPAPPGPAPGEAAPGGGQAAQLAELDRRMRENIEADLADHGIEPDQDESPEIMGGNPATKKRGGNPAEPDYSDGADPGEHDTVADVMAQAPEFVTGEEPPDPTDQADSGSTGPSAGTAPAEPEEGPADKAKSQVLAERFEALGWNPRRHRADVLRACTMFLRRRIATVRDMSTGEIMKLTGELSAIQRSFEPGHYPVALADAVEAWRAAWEAEDAADYADVTGERL